MTEVSHKGGDPQFVYLGLQNTPPAHRKAGAFSKMRFVPDDVLEGLTGKMLCKIMLGEAFWSILLHLY